MSLSTDWPKAPTAPASSAERTSVRPGSNTGHRRLIAWTARQRRSDVGPMISDNGVLDAVLFIVVLLPSVIFHEVSHGVVARRLGDPTAKEAGRAAVNPIPPTHPLR